MYKPDIGYRLVSVNIRAHLCIFNKRKEHIYVMRFFSRDTHCK